MWKKRRQRNRRFEREHILDVKVESRQLRAMRVRFVVNIFARVFGVGVALFLLWRGGDWLLNEFVFTNPAFAVQEIEVETDGILPKALIRGCAGVKQGDNLLALNLSRIQRDLEYFPWIQSAAVERVRPGRVKIRVIEREPIARTTLFEPGMDGKTEEVVFYFDAGGHVMLPLDTHRVEASVLGFDTLPLLTGIGGVDLRPGHRVESAQILAALKLLTEFAHSPMLGLADITTVDLSQPQVLVVSSAQGATVTFSPQSLHLQLKRWRLVLDYAAGRGKVLASLDLSVTNNVPARWAEGAVVPTPRPRFVKPSPYRKKNV